MNLSKFRGRAGARRSARRAGAARRGGLAQRAATAQRAEYETVLAARLQELEAAIGALGAVVLTDDAWACLASPQLESAVQEYLRSEIDR